jgi:hypothetical protein
MSFLSKRQKRKQQDEISIVSNSSKNSDATANSTSTQSTSSGISDGNININLKDSKYCQWNKCSFNGTEAQLIDHLQLAHVTPQRKQNKFKCLWKSCKVYKAQSCSYTWLESHVFTHVDLKPFACIITGCQRKFPTKATLEKHVNEHITNYENQSPTKAIQHQISHENSSNDNQQQQQGLQTAQGVARVRSTRKRRVLYKNAQFKDYIDDYSYEKINSTLDSMNFNSGIVKFKANLIGNKVENGKNWFLIEWLPKNM